MKNILPRVVEFAKTRPIIFGLGVLLLAQGFIFGSLFTVLSFIGWLRIFVALLIVAGYVVYKFARYEMDSYKDAISNFYGEGEPSESKVAPSKSMDHDWWV